MTAQADSLRSHSLRRRLLSGGGWSLAGKTGTILATLTTSVLLARLLSVEDLGFYFLGLSMAMVSAMVGRFGVEYAVLRLVSEFFGKNQPAMVRKVIRTVFRICFLSGGVVVLTLWLGVWDFVASAFFHSPSLMAVSGLGVLWCAGLIFQILFGETFRGFQDIRLAAVHGGLLSGWLSAGVFFALWLQNHPITLTTAFLITVSALGVNALLALVPLVMKLRALPWESGRYGSKDVLQVALPMLFSVLANFVKLQGSLWLLGAMASPPEVAVFGTASRLAMVVFIPLEIINGFVGPMIGEFFYKGETERLEKVLRATAALAAIPATLAAVVFTLFGAEVLGLLFGTPYREGAVILLILSLGHLTAVWCGSGGNVLLMTGHHRTVMWITIYTSLFNILLGFGALKIWGVTEMAIVAALAVAGQGIYTTVVVKKCVNIWTIAKPGSFKLLVGPIPRG